MTKLFLNLLNISVTASFIIIAVLLLRIFLKKFPKNYTCILWGLVALRLALPFNIESAFSLVPSGEIVSPNIFSSSTSTNVLDTGFEGINSVINPTVENFIENNKTPLEAFVFIAAIIWLSVAVIMLLIGAISYLRLKWVLRFSVKDESSCYNSDAIKTPFIFGIFNPKIYLPFNIAGEEKELIIKHEKAHLSRLDNITKIFAYILLSIYWFNPLVWVYYLVLQRDIEIACDQKVIKTMPTESKQLYSITLLKYSTSSKLHALTPIAFGEISVKQRIKNIMSYKKPTIWISIAFILIVTITILAFMTTPIKDGAENSNTTNENTSVEYDEKYQKFINAIENGTYEQTITEFESLLGGDVGIENTSNSDKSTQTSTDDTSSTKNIESTIPITIQSKVTNPKTKEILIDDLNWKDYFEIVYKTLKCTDDNEKTSTITFPYCIKLKKGYEYAPDNGENETTSRVCYESTVEHYYCEFDKNGRVTALNKKSANYESYKMRQILNLNESTPTFYSNGEIKTFENGKAIMAIHTNFKIEYFTGALYILDK